MLVGGKDAEYATEFLTDVKSRLANRVQLTSDGHKAYLQAVKEAFDGKVDYAMLVKMYGPAGPLTLAGAKFSVVTLRDSHAPAAFSSPFPSPPHPL